MSSSHTYFITGFPGFIANQLIQQILHSEYAIAGIHVLVLPSLMERAKGELAEMAVAEGVSADLFTIVEGDITKEHLNMSEQQRNGIQASVTHVFHLAAIYDLAVPYKFAYEVNVVGTRHVTAWVSTLTALSRYIYFSTAYVSGRREGRILESELVKGQTFKNHYESTKYEAEVIVQQVMDQIPTTIIRPGIVKGHSETGETIKFDGPYFILNMVDRLSFLPVIPKLGRGMAQGNFVPVDYIFNAVMYLSHHDIGIDKVYHLADPKPYPMHEVYRMLMNAYLGREPRGMIPLAWVKPFMRFSAIRKWLRVEKEGLDYFDCMTEYDCSQAVQDLQGTDISCPDFHEAIVPMVEYYRKHKDDSSKQLKIK